LILSPAFAEFETNAHGVLRKKHPAVIQIILFLLFVRVGGKTRHCDERSGKVEETVSVMLVFS
jgi:hypothetical protein